MRVIDPKDEINKFLKMHCDDRINHESIINGAAEVITQLMNNVEPFVWSTSVNNHSIFGAVIEAVSQIESDYDCYNETRTDNNDLIIKRLLEI